MYAIYGIYNSAESMELLIQLDTFSIPRSKNNCVFPSSIELNYRLGLNL